MNDLFEFAKSGDVASIHKMVSEGEDLHVRNECGDTLLSIAAGSGKYEVVQYFVDKGIDLHVVNDFGFSALSSALWCSHMEIAHYLASKGARINIECAAGLGNIDLLEKHLGETTIEDMIGAYLYACRCGQQQTVQWFIDNKMPVDLHPPGSEWGGIGCPGLHHAVENGHLATVQLLLKNGADIHLVDDVYKSNALAWAAGAGRNKIAMLLLEAGASASQRNIDGLTAIDLAEKYGFPGLAQQMRSYKL